MSAVFSLADQHQAHIERQSRMGRSPSLPVVRLDLIRPAPPAPKLKPKPAPEPIKAETRGEFIELPNFLPVGRAHLSATFRQSNSTIILNTVSGLTGVSILDMKSKRRSGQILIPRQVACWAIKRLTRLSLPRIGAVMGGRDHTTILHAVRKIEKLRASDEKVRALSDEVYAKAWKIICVDGDEASE